MEFISTNHHILEKVFIFCKTPALLQCRLVCRLWAEEVSRILKKRGIRISFRSPEDIEDFLQVSRPISYTYTNILLDIPSPRSPSQVVEQVPSQVADLLDCCKYDVLEVKLWYQPLIPPATQVASTEETQVENQQSSNNEDNLSSSSLGVITLEQLHTLNLLSNYVHPSSLAQSGGQPQVQHQMPKFFSHLVTPNLRYLAIQHLYDTDCASTVTRLIESSNCPLESLKIPAKPFPVVALGTSLMLLQNLRELDLLGIFNGFSCATNETLDSVIKCCPKLEKLAIEFSFRATLDKIQEMFTKLANTLVEFKCTIQDRNLLARQIIRVDFIFPEMTRLKVLQMRWSNPGLVYYVDRLPALEELMLDSVWTKRVQGSIFPGGQPFQDGMSQYTKLCSLKLTETVSVEQIEVFAKYFPNLQVLGCSFASNEALRLVYEKMNRLKWLIIERKSNVTEAAGVCGVNCEDEMARKVGELACENTLTEENQSDGKYLLIQISRTVPYIGNLQNLETLELCQLGISWWSILYGVVDLPNLKTLVVQSKALKVQSDNNSTVNKAILTFLASRLGQLRNLTLWIRHTSERLSPEETKCIQEILKYLDEITVVNHSLCGIIR